MELSKTKAIISGGLSGLGLTVARFIVRKGGTVTLLDINADRATDVLNELGEQAHFIQADVSNEQEISAAVDEATHFADGLNAAISCAGVLGPGRVLGREAPLPLNVFSRTIQVNLVGSFNVAKAAANIMQHNEPGDDGERGVIINTASIAAYEGQIGQAAYSASKGGVVGMTLPMAREFTRFGVRVMTIAPGVFHTPMVDGMSEEIQQALAAKIPFPSRLGDPEEFAALAGHIIENRYLNGSVIRLDGATRLEPR